LPPPRTRRSASGIESDESAGFVSSSRFAAGKA